jgi:hypothetical protein
LLYDTPFAAIAITFKPKGGAIMSEQSETQTIFRFVTVRSPKKSPERSLSKGMESDSKGIEYESALTILQTASGALDVNGLPCACKSKDQIAGSTGALLRATKS